MKKTNVVIYILCCLTFIWHSCLNEDLSKIKSKGSWEGQISLPAGSIQITSEGYNAGIPLIDMYKMLGMVIVTEVVEFPFEELVDNYDYLDSLILSIDITNNFPAELQIYAYFMDASGKLNSSVDITGDEPILIDKPDIDAEGHIPEPVHPYPPFKYKFSEEDLPDLLPTERILIRVFIKNMDLSEEVVNNIDDFSVDINVGIRLL